MKKLLLFVALIVAIWVTSKAQTVNLSSTDNSYLSLSTAVTITNTTAKTVYFNAAVNYPTTQDFRTVVTKGTGALSNVAIAFYGSKFGDTWTQIGSTVNWKLTTADTTVVISNATANRFRKYKTVYTGTGTGTAVINPQYLKLYFE